MLETPHEDAAPGAFCGLHAAELPLLPGSCTKGSTLLHELLNRTESRAWPVFTAVPLPELHLVNHPQKYLGVRTHFQRAGKRVKLEPRKQCPLIHAA